MEEDITQQRKIISFMEDMQWSGVMGIVPALALLLPFFAIMCFILLLFGIDTSKDIENYMIFTG